MAFRNAILKDPSPERIQSARRDLADPATLRHSIWLTKRCVNDYREQVEPGLKRGVATSILLERMRTRGRFSVAPPIWHHDPHRLDLGYVIIDNQIALPIRFDSRSRAPYAAVCCLQNSQPSLNTRPLLDRSPSLR